MAEYVDWFENMFGADTSGNVDTGTGGDPGNYSGESYDAMFERVFGDVGGSPGFETVEGTSAGGGSGLVGSTFHGAPEASAPEGGSTLAGALSAGLGTLGSWFEKIAAGAGKLFTEQPSTTTRINPLTGKPEMVQSAGGGLNSLGQLLLSGAIQGLGQSSVLKWQAETAEKSKKKAFEREKTFEKEKRAEDFARKAYGVAPQIGAPTRGVGLIKQTGVA